MSLEIRSNLEVLVEIFAPVIERIRNAVSGSQVEEGGKFIGKIRQNRNKLNIIVETYIDSGPRVDNSSGHLMPDGDYQEKMFRVVEKFDQDIDYIGSWHSHHCNGYPDLSSGDISGYKTIVNDPRQKVDYFFVLLVTALRENQIQKQCYLFMRGQDRHFELPDSAVQIIDKISSVESILERAERISFQYRGNSSSYSRASETRARATKFDTQVDLLQKIRAEDHQWILRKFPSVKTAQNKNDSSISWKWQISLENGDFNIFYKHPSYSPSEPAHLEVFCNGEQFLAEDIPLNSSRFDKIEECIKECIILNQARSKTKLTAEEKTISLSNIRLLISFWGQVLGTLFHSDANKSNR